MDHLRLFFSLDFIVKWKNVLFNSLVGDHTGDDEVRRSIMKDGDAMEGREILLPKQKALSRQYFYLIIYRQQFFLKI